MPKLMRPSTGQVARFEWTEDPADPCGYCVHWEETDGFEEGVPLTPDGPATRIYRFVHDDCEKAVMAYIEESANV